MAYANEIRVSRNGALWYIADAQGIFGCADSADILRDCVAYAKIHKVRNSEQLKERFSHLIVFLR